MLSFFSASPSLSRIGSNCSDSVHENSTATYYVPSPHQTLKSCFFSHGPTPGSSLQSESPIFTTHHSEFRSGAPFRDHNCVDPPAAVTFHDHRRLHARIFPEPEIFSPACCLRHFETAANVEKFFTIPKCGVSSSANCHTHTKPTYGTTTHVRTVCKLVTTPHTAHSRIACASLWRGSPGSPL